MAYTDVLIFVSIHGIHFTKNPSFLDFQPALRDSERGGLWHDNQATTIYKNLFLKPEPYTFEIVLCLKMDPLLTFLIQWVFREPNQILWTKN